MEVVVLVRCLPSEEGISILRKGWHAHWSLKRCYILENIGVFPDLLTYTSVFFPTCANHIIITWSSNVGLELLELSTWPGVIIYVLPHFFVTKSCSTSGSSSHNWRESVIWSWKEEWRTFGRSIMVCSMKKHKWIGFNLKLPWMRTRERSHSTRKTTSGCV